MVENNQIDNNQLTPEEEEAIERGILLTSLEVIKGWARKNSMWPLGFGLACCAIEMMDTGASYYDLDRFGIIFRSSPRQADVMIVAGTVTKKMAPVVTRLYEQMAEPKWVVAMGACAISGGPYVNSYSVVNGVDKLIPVDVYVPGCPASPASLLHGLTLLQDKIAHEARHGKGVPIDHE